MKCKNIECENETKGKRVYCSLKCRNIYVNKYLRDYSKTSEGFDIRRKEREKEYYSNPKRCKECDKVLPFDKKKNEFCDNSCSATFNNKGNIKSEETKENISNSIKKFIDENGKFGCLLRKSKGKIKKCKSCNKEFFNKNRKYCSTECRKEYRRKDMTEYQKYKADTHFNFSLSDYPDEFDFSLIGKYGWYSPTNKNNNLGGVSRDHILSVREGYELGIDPFLLSHPANCRLMVHNKNISKNKHSDITLKELKERIKIFESKYGKYEK